MEFMLRVICERRVEGKEKIIFRRKIEIKCREDRMGYLSGRVKQGH